MLKYLESITVASVVAIALVLRLWGIAFGLPYVYHFDEHFYVNTALQLGAGVWNNPPYTATGLPNILFGEYALYYVVGRALGWFESTAQFETTYRSDPTVFYLLGRITVATMATATVLTTHALGRAIRNTQTGLLAALLLAITFLHVRDAHYAVPDAATPFFIVFAVLLAIHSIDGQSRLRQWRLALAGVAGGLAVAVKWIALPVALPVCWAALCQRKQPSGADKDKKTHHLLLAITSLVVGFSLGSPQILINPAPYLQEALGQYSAGQTGGFEFWLIDSVPGWLFYLKTLWWGLGPVLIGLAVVGGIMRLADGIRTQQCASWLLILFPIVYYLLMGSTRHYFARYVLPLTPFLALFAAEAITVTAEWLMVNKGIGVRWAVFSVLTLSAIAQPLTSSIRHDGLLTGMDTRTIAKTWVERNIPAGAKIAVDWPTHGPPLSTFERPAPNSTHAYDVTLVGGTGLSDHPLEWYRSQGYEYLVASSFIYQIPLVSPERDQERKAFYASLGREFTEIQVFHPTSNGSEPNFIFDEIYGPAINLWQRMQPGPTIRVYWVVP